MQLMSKLSSLFRKNNMEHYQRKFSNELQKQRGEMIKDNVVDWNKSEVLIDHMQSHLDNFIEYAQNHLDKDQEVKCKICDKTIDEIWEEENG